MIEQRGTDQFSQEDLIPISAIADFVFCERRAALHFIEYIWHENLFTVEGTILHDKVHETDSESRGDVRIERGVAMRSLRLGLSGKSDVVEYHRQPNGQWRPFPVEYKRGKLKHGKYYEVQLCAQAMCLEEMLNVVVPYGAIFYGKTRRRLDVTFDGALRQETEEAATKAHALIDAGITPAPAYSKRCESCSLMAECMPQAIQKKRSVESYIKRMIGET
jgi:CRISPR-associated exonuclease Cas4